MQVILNSLFASLLGEGLKANSGTGLLFISIFLRPLQTRTHCWGHIVAYDVSWAAQTEKTFFVSRTQNSCPQQILRARVNGETFVSATMCRQQCVGNNVSATMCRQQCVLVCQGPHHQGA